jgi:hypothetical protein
MKRTLALSVVILAACGTDPSHSPTDTATETAEDTTVDSVSDPTDDGRCTYDDQCQNGLFCDGAETCTSGACQPGTPIQCNDHDPCTLDSCDEEAAACAHTPSAPQSPSAPTKP